MVSSRDLIGFAAAASPEETLFWSGAGISVDPPTCGPKGEELTQRALQHAFLPSVAETVSRYYRKLDISDQRSGRARTSPRLETVLQVVETVHGQEVLADLLSDLKAEPNPLHRFFAGHLSRGGSHVTMNFDTCIERAGGDGLPPGAPLHVHGQLGSEAIGATLARIERGLPKEIRAPLTETLLSPRVRSIVFVGYSGSDFFDVDPFLASLSSNALAGREVLWIEHKTDAREVEPKRRQLRALREAGARVREVEMQTRPALAEMGRSWSLTLGESEGDRRPWRSEVSIDGAMKRQASIELFSLMGLHKEVEALLEPRGPHDWELRAHTRWAEGRYVEAGTAWTIARAEGSDAARAERVGAVAWIRGEYRRAREVLATALEEPGGTPEERIALAETLARVFVHMRRSPDSYLLAKPALRNFILEYLPDPAELAAAGEPVGTHLANRLVSARLSLGAQVRERPDPVESFGEYEALNAQLNYRQGELRSRPWVRFAELRQLHRDFEAIGASGDAARAVLLAGPCVFRWRRLRDAADRLQVTRRQRKRLLASSLAGSTVRCVRYLRFRLRARRIPGFEAIPRARADCR